MRSRQATIVSVSVVLSLATSRTIPRETMKRSVLFALIVACAFALLLGADAVPADDAKQAKDPKEAKDATTGSKDADDAKESWKNRKYCAKKCGTAYDPVCAHDPNDANFKPRTFGTQCALDVHNCEMGTKLVVKSKGECPGAGGVRLS